MATRIQAGERQKAKRLLGILMGGASSESLSCNALEWQVFRGGWTDHREYAVTVNNPETARAWERALRWVGTISPPGVISYKEWMRTTSGEQDSGFHGVTGASEFCEASPGSVTKTSLV